MERALSAKERHKLGAHYTPRAYVERLVKPTIEEPSRAEWDVVRAQLRTPVESGKKKDATDAIAIGLGQWQRTLIRGVRDLVAART